MILDINPTDNTPIYQQIEDQIKNYIFSGRLKPGDKLPSIRSLAKELKISVITTKRAYDDLEAEGIIVSRQGKGSFVNEQSIESIKQNKLSFIDEAVEQLVSLCKTYGITKKELIETINIIFE